jgi:transposase
MSMTSKSPRMVLLVAYEVGMEALPPYSHPCSPKTFTQPQLFACLVLMLFWKTDYRGLSEALADLPSLREAIGLRRVPHFTTFQKAHHRLMRASSVHRLFDIAVRRALRPDKTVDLAAVDSTGLDSHHISRYFVKRRSRQPSLWQTTTYTRYPKLGIVCDCWRHVILSALSARGPSPDVHQFERTVALAVRRVRIRHLVADAGYDSERNHRLAREEWGIRTTIPSRYGRPTSKAPSTHYRRLMHRHMNPFAYGQRWQVETTFSVLKRRLGTTLRSKTYWGQGRDTALLALAYNILILLCLVWGFLRSIPDPFRPFRPFR